MARTQSGPPVVWIWAGVALLAVLLVSVLLWVILMPRGEQIPTSSRIVPDLIDVSSQRAQADLEELDLLSTVVFEANTEITEGNVIRTDPAAEQSVEMGQTVTVYVSAGAETVLVPKIIGLSQSAAVDALEAVGLELGNVNPENDAESAAETVLAISNVDEGDEVAPGSSVNLVVASGKVALEDVQGFTVAAATTRLESLKLTAIPTSIGECSELEVPGVVLSLSLAPGDVPVHSEVELRYCE